MKKKINEIPGFIKAIEAAKKSEGIGQAKYRLGAAIYNKTKYVSSGFNKKKTHPISKGKYKYLHAESDSLVKAIKLVGTEGVDGCIMYVVRLGRKDAPLMAKPCKHCQAVLGEFGIRKIYYSDRNGKVSELEI